MPLATACGNDAVELQRLANMCLQAPEGFPVAKALFRIAMEEGNDSAGVSYAILLSRGDYICRSGYLIMGL